MTAAVEMERCSHSVAGVKMRFVDLDIKKGSLQTTPPSAAVRVESNPIPPPADELAERLAELEKLPETPNGKDLRPVPSPLAKNTSKASDSSQSHQDSGYASIASSPEGLEPEKSQDSGFSSTKLRVFDRAVPEYLQHRFYDMKVLYSEDLLKAVYKKNVDQKDLSMKLKYLGKSEPSAELYIVVQCEAKYTKKVKKFFAQTIVQEYLGKDFKLHVINRAPRGLFSAEDIKVYGQSNLTTKTLCGQPIMLSNGETSAFATVGGVLQVVKSPDDKPQLYGFTAAHSLISLLRVHPESLDDDISESSDDDDDLDGDDDDDDDILFDVPSDDEMEADQQSFDIQSAGMLGNIVANSINMTTNRDWSLISLTQPSWLPNLLPADHSKEQAIYFSNASLPFSYCANVAVITCHGLQQGKLETNKSFLFSSPGAELIQTYDLKLAHDSILRPGDSGSWVVDPNTGRVLGHVASIDAFGEAFVVPMHGTLADVREYFDAASVTLPSRNEIEKLLFKPTSPSPAASPSPPVEPGTVSSSSAMVPLQPSAEQRDNAACSMSVQQPGSIILGFTAQPSASAQPDKPEKKVYPAPSPTGAASDSVPDPKKKHDSDTPAKSRLSDMVKLAKRILTNPITKRAVNPAVQPSMQYPVPPMYYSPHSVVYPPPDMPPYYKGGMLDEHGVTPFLYAQMQPVHEIPQQAMAGYVGQYPELPSEAVRPYAAPGYTPSGHDSGYSSLQPSAQCSPAPSPPQPRQGDEP